MGVTLVFRTAAPREFPDAVDVYQRGGRMFVIFPDGRDSLPFDASEIVVARLTIPTGEVLEVPGLAAGEKDADVQGPGR